MDVVVLRLHSKVKTRKDVKAHYIVERNESDMYGGIGSMSIDSGQAVLEKGEVFEVIGYYYLKAGYYLIEGRSRDAAPDDIFSKLHYAVPVESWAEFEEIQ